MIEPPTRALLAATRASLDTAEAAATTVALRLPILATAVLAPSPAGLAEARLATFEKVAAVVEGTVAATLAWQKLWLDFACGRVGPRGLQSGLSAIAAAATAPARRRVLANARRLQRRSP
ncbi:hypothetical protein QNA08_16740 [Chelatococcus sp. SYSU_G07232]|uniref:Uncharacterized protein n=1 Tax=Chelatococcus albus TaxID=3047466 RepID=A0ABT7AKH6_9HYPH|nr:hypothetical protein [Chelatococcus sp. SYSU_G07232]MDJ1159869.1 hypothetical protein [Chelatococcus sp. SYSU_G07232]